MSTIIRAFPSSESSIRRTRPIGKPENVKSIPTITPSESSAINITCWVLSNTPRAYITYASETQIIVTIKTTRASALNSIFGGGVEDCSEVSSGSSSD